MLEDFLQRGHGLVGAVAGGGTGIDLRRTIHVEAHGEFRAVTRFGRHQRGERHGFSLAVAHVELSGLLDLAAEFTGGLHVDLPLQTEAVEVIDHRAAEKGLQRVVGAVDGHALRHGHLAVDIEFDLRNGGQERGVEPLKFGPLGRGCHERLGVLGEELHRATAAVLQDEVHPAGCADAGNGRWRKGEGHALGQRGEVRVDAAHDVLVLRLRRGALVPRLERDEEKSVVGGLHRAEQVEPDDGGDVFHAGGVHDDLLDLLARLAGALHRGGVGQLHAGVEVSLVFLGQEGGRQAAAEHSGQGGHAAEDEEADECFADGHAASAHIFVRSAPEHGVEPFVESAERPAGVGFRAEDEGGERRTERESVEGRNTN